MASAVSLASSAKATVWSSLEYEMKTWLVGAPGEAPGPNNGELGIEAGCTAGLSAPCPPILGALPLRACVEIGAGSACDAPVSPRTGALPCAPEPAVVACSLASSPLLGSG